MFNENLWKNNFSIGNETYDPFEDPKKLHRAHDYRVFLANRICKLLYEKYDGDLNKIFKGQETIWFMEDFDDQSLIDNVYELAHPYIPLYFFYYPLTKQLIDKHVYNETFKIAEEVCRAYY